MWQLWPKKLLAKYGHFNFILDQGIAEISFYRKWDGAEKAIELYDEHEFRGNAINIVLGDEVITDIDISEDMRDIFGQGCLYTLLS